MKPVPFMRAAMELADICTEIETTDADISESLLARFSEAEAHLAQSIDRRRAFLDEIKSKKALGKERKKEIDKVIGVLDRIETNLKKITVDAIKMHPNEPFRDSLGQKLSISKAKPKLNLRVGTTVSLTHVVPKELELDPRFLKCEVRWRVDKEAVSAALEAGEVLPWAEFETTEYLRGL